jgi:hypothetical protein
MLFVSESESESVSEFVFVFEGGTRVRSAATPTDRAYTHHARRHPPSNTNSNTDSLTDTPSIRKTCDES